MTSVTIANDAVWQLPPDPLILIPDQVHLWRVSLAVAPSMVEALYGVLCERARAERFHFGRDRQQLYRGPGSAPATAGLLPGESRPRANLSLWSQR